MNSNSQSLPPDYICEEYSDSGIRISLKDLDDEVILIEGDKRSLEFLGKLILTQAAYAEDDGFEISPSGAGSSFFAAGSKGIYIHRTEKNNRSPNDY